MKHQKHILAVAIAAAFPHPQYAWADDQEMTFAPVVVTTRRVETKLDDAPQRIEVVNNKDIDKTFQNDLTDLLKKNASVDVIQYPGGLSGIGIRGFTPEYGGINRHSVLLIDGRPVSADNMATINSGSIEQVEVMKGPGSALYGSGAMGGVVSMVSRQSKGDVRAQADLSFGQFNTQEAKLRAGGNIAPSLDFDYAGSLINAGDFKLGNGQTRPATGYKMDNHSIRGGLDINNEWRLVGKLMDWKGRDVYSPGDLAYGTNAQQKKQMAISDRDLRLTGHMCSHSLSGTVFSGTQFSESTILTSTTIAFRPQLPAVQYAQDLTFSGWQAQDAWSWSQDSILLFGIDTQKAKSVSRLYELAVAGSPRKAPGTADNQRLSRGIFAENSWAFNEGKSSAYVGIRRDNIDVETLYTPLKTGFTPSKSSFTATNPSAGFKHSIVPGWDIHATIGKAFVAPDALYVTGNYQTPRTLPGGTVVIDTTTGNPNIRPENSLSKDFGVEWSTSGFSVDLTMFDTKVKDKIVAVKTTNPDKSVATTYANAQDGSIQGVELQSHWSFARNCKLTFGGTQYLHDWTITNGMHVDSNIVPKQSFKIAFDADNGAWSGRLSARYRGRMKDQDWVTGGGKQVEYGGFTVADLNVRYRIDKAQTVALSVENLMDRFYTEKFGYNMSGRNMRANYRYEF